MSSMAGVFQILRRRRSGESGENGAQGGLAHTDMYQALVFRKKSCRLGLEYRLIVPGQYSCLRE